MLAARVNHALMSAGIEGYEGLRIEAESGSVTLSGTLPTRALAERAVELVRGVDGVTTVVSRLHVGEQR